MSWQSNLVRILLVAVVLTVVIELFFQPQISLDPASSFVITFILQLFALGFASWLAEGQNRRVFVRTLIVSFLMAIFIDVLLNPKTNLGLAWTFIAVLIVEVFGILGAWALARRADRSKR